ncbi:hypothetical protein AQUCO_05900053v1 [Aquilegia coerulea]|uniref:Uncharacterized protein n=1 Tax=Aquilegia coerulea TaxID=218851 RepID=A0A2G5CE53_AQUCA|nr:hypothetical protein AQUCO_05900053v1 [Aquilegia coerulea]
MLGEEKSPPLALCDILWNGGIQRDLYSRFQTHYYQNGFLQINLIVGKRYNCKDCLEEHIVTEGGLGCTCSKRLDLVYQNHILYV